MLRICSTRFQNLKRNLAKAIAKFRARHGTKIKRRRHWRCLFYVPISRLVQTMQDRLDPDETASDKLALDDVLVAVTNPRISACIWSSCHSRGPTNTAHLCWSADSKKLVGRPVTPISRDNDAFGSNPRRGVVTPFARNTGNALFTPPRSNEISTTSIPSWCNCSAAICKDGISAIHGAHQLAQKFIKSGRPRKLSKVNGLPSSSVTGWVMEGAAVIFCPVETARALLRTLATGEIMPPT